MSASGHRPVLLAEVIHGLDIRPGGCYADCTFGGGGHSQAILQRLGAAGRLFVFDKDERAIQCAHRRHAVDVRVHAVHGPFTQLRRIIHGHQLLGKVDGVLLDLGVSSLQLDAPERGFSCRREGPLDMRMNTSGGITARDWINATPVDEMATAFKAYGEQKFARRIARAIAQRRCQSAIETTTQLAATVSAAVPARGARHKKHPATKVFQAIRIVINQELAELQAVLPQTLEALAAGGRLAVISFHSLEDRIVKRFIREQQKADPYPHDLPIKAIHIRPRLLAIGGPLRPSAAELKANSRASSAVLRLAERTAA